jgi:hypothetical protein
MAQTATSKATSINSKRLPAIYGKINLHGVSRIVDYGCGRYIEHIRANIDPMTQYLPFDPFNQPDEINMATRNACADGAQGIGIISNVLNVIDDDLAVENVIDDCLRLTNGGMLYITVYEGDRSGVGRYTGADSYQRNMTVKQWEKWLLESGYLVYRENGLLCVFNG